MVVSPINVATQADMHTASNNNPYVCKHMYITRGAPIIGPAISYQSYQLYLLVV